MGLRTKLDLTNNDAQQPTKASYTSTQNPQRTQMDHPRIHHRIQPIRNAQLEGSSVVVTGTLQSWIAPRYVARLNTSVPDTE